MVDDSYTIALLHMDGENASTIFRDETGKAWTANGSAQISTAQAKFGQSVLFDGAGDYIESADSSDWQLDGGSNSNEWTFEAWLRFTSGFADVGFFGQYVSNSNFHGLTLNTSTNNLQYIIRSGGTNIVIIQNTWTPSANIWYHVALVKQGTTGYKMFIDGTQIGSTATDTDTCPDFAAPMWIGHYINNSGTSFDMNGYMDEVRFSKGVARYTANFTPRGTPFASEKFFVMM